MKYGYGCYVVGLVLICLEAGWLAAELPAAKSLDKFAYKVISQEQTKKLKAVRNSYGSITKLSKLYTDRTHKNGLPYHIYVPMNLKPGCKYPLVTFLHGYSDLTIDTHKGFPKGVWSLPLVQKDHAHILFVPRYRTFKDMWVQPKFRAMVIEALDDLVKEFNGNQKTPNIDPCRLYLTGFSQGGMGTWNYIKTYPHKFAAAAPLSGFSHGPQDVTQAEAIKHIPIWIFNGDGDRGVGGSRLSFKMLKQAQARDVKYHEYKKQGHVIDDFAYFTKGFMDWFFAQKLKSCQDPIAGEIPFEFFASFKRIGKGDPLIALKPPLWAAATHAIVVDDTIHYYWCKREIDRRWLLMHATAPVSDPTDIKQNLRNPIVSPSKKGFDDQAVEYPFPFLNPADNKYYMYYRGKGKGVPEQTGLLVCDGDMGKWKRAGAKPVILANTKHEADGATHPSVAIDGKTIHIVYTGKATRSYHDGLTMCHATAPISNPAKVTKNPDNPVFKGSGAKWDSRCVRETELFKGPKYFHILYGGFDGKVWRIGHVRTRDFRTFEANPHNPVFSPSPDPKAFDSQSVLTGQIIKIGETWWMLYAGRKGKEWQTGLARTSKP
ncbi:MAG: hypothetical protein QGG42_21850 [Phycisphaerae bacterium]|nr:hypothetical protein [Phycisphaerae bacterium]